ncbi:acyl-CoA dehydrogenase family protein [Candidatus Binatia bacterium]|jgi:acyl-CoA dehydrogenase|nr:acyl-CoA dehydrogenase family protein [Candidatus Binatia bacterium]
MAPSTFQPTSWRTPDIEEYRAQVRRFVATEVAPHQQRWAKQQHVDRELWNKAGALGMLASDVPSEYGGSDGNVAHQTVMIEELTAVGDTAFSISVHAIVQQYILKQGTEEQKRRYLPKLASGEMVGAIAMTEPGGGSDLQGVRTRAERQGDHWVLNGAKTFISNGFLADLVVVVARTGTEPGARGISLLLVETKDRPGYRVGRVLEKLGQKGQDTCELFFEDVHVPADAVLGGETGRGFYQLMTELPYERTLIAISAVAAVERAVQITADYARERMVFGKPLLEMQNTRFVLADAKTKALVARTFLDRCIEALAEGRMDSVTASMAKLWTTDLQCEVIDDCLQLFGGYGYMLEYPIAQMYADARVQRIYGGANEIMKELIARSL